MAEELARLRDLQAELIEKRRRVARALVKRKGWSLRDVGQVIGLSFQRVEQLVSNEG